MDRDVFRRPAWRGYAFAVVAWLFAFAVRWALADWFPPGFPFLTFFPVVVLVAFYAGLRPAILTATLSGLSAWWFWVGPTGFDLGVASLVALGFYAFVVTIDIFFIVGMDGASRQLARQVERNAALAESRDVLLKEVQHRVSNNIQVVSALLAVEARAAVDPAARKALTDASARTALIARIQRSLADAEAQATAFGTLATAIAADALKAAARDDVRLTVSGEGVGLSAEEATPVILIMLESVNNALEHGLPDRAGEIAVTLRDDGTVRTLTVADNGVGLAPQTPSQPQSLGLKIVHALARQLGGEWTLKPGAARGAVATLIWPSLTLRPLTKAPTPSS